MRYNMNPADQPITALPNGNVDFVSTVPRSSMVRHRGLQLPSAATEVAYPPGTAVRPRGPSSSSHQRRKRKLRTQRILFHGHALLGVNDTSLYNTLGGLWTNIFLASIDPNGQVVTKPDT